MRFEEPYFKDRVVSNYTDYTKREHSALCGDLISLGILRSHRIVDFGCATGSLLAEFYSRGFRNIVGTDVSYWAIKQGRQQYSLGADILQFLNYNLLAEGADWVFALDVLEHIGTEELKCIIDLLHCKRLVVLVPVSEIEGKPYANEVSKKDSTHIQCHTKDWWLQKLMKFSASPPIMLPTLYESIGALARVFHGC